MRIKQSISHYFLFVFQFSEVHIFFELNEDQTIPHPSISTIIKSPNNFWIEWEKNIPSIHFKLIIIMGMINNSTWPFNCSEFIHELAHSIWSCNHNQLIDNQYMLINSVTMQVHCHVLGTTLFSSILKIHLRLMLRNFQLIIWRQVGH